ncbi:MAG: cbb3-type cytochrome oxidase assembly protein CcoS [Neisseriaceae bacterium]|nr:cbb3-type cytochrome oxidase assembly protein CcoS [Neisseriaceae bacterium]
MESLYILIPVSLILVFLIAFLFWWSTQSGQFDDLKGPAYQILMDDDRPTAIQSNSVNTMSPTQEIIQKENNLTVS